MARKHWTPEDDELLRKLYPHQATSSFCELFGASVEQTYRRAFKLALYKTAACISTGPGAQTLMRAGAPFRFPKGHVPANKGLRRPGYAPGRMKETQFRKGQVPRNWDPVGTVKFNTDGYLRRKIADPNVWEFIHRRVWEDAHGPIPKGHRIWWKDGDHGNCALENLELISGREHMARTTVHTLPPDLKATVYAVGALNRAISRRKRSAEK
jgi:hypothetical protein